MHDVAAFPCDLYLWSLRQARLTHAYVKYFTRITRIQSVVSPCMICKERVHIGRTKLFLHAASCMLRIAKPRIAPSQTHRPSSLPSNFPITSRSLILIHLLHPYHLQFLLDFVSGPLPSFAGTMCRTGYAFLDVIGALLPLVFGFLAATRSSNLELVEHPLGATLN